MYIEYMVINIFLILCILYSYKYNVNIIYSLDEETAKKLAEASLSGNNVNIHNPNINIPGSFAKAITGIGGAIAGGMTAVSHLAKSSAMPLGVKVVTTAIGGGIAGDLFVATNAMNTIAQKGLDNKNSRNGSSSSSSSSNGSFPASSIIENSEAEPTAIDKVMDLLNTNLMLNISMLSILIGLAILYISNKVANKK